MSGKPGSPPATVEASTAFVGVDHRPEGTRFGVVAEADAVGLELVHPGTLETRRLSCVRDHDDPLVWRVEAEGDFRGWRYSYAVDRDGRVLSGIVDPWAELIRDDQGYLCADRTPVAPRPVLESPTDAVIYELHVRDFTRHHSSGLPWNERGTYPGLWHRGSVLEGSELPTGLDHLLDLGINVVQLMPVHAFAMPYDARYEWGYMPLFFNAPMDTYASSVDVEAPVRELKEAVSALHEAGLRVTLDVVYNHTAEFWPDRLRSLMALAPREYFRFKDDGTPWDGSACGNEFRSESVHGRRFIIESIAHWVTHYGVDGFRFDLMGLIDAETMDAVVREVRAIDESILIYGEPWTGGETPIEVNDKGTQRSRGWAVFNDEIRDALRGEVFEIEDPAFAISGAKVDELKKGIRGSVGTFADAPGESLNYVEAHDNHTLADRLVIAAAGASETERMHMARLAFLSIAVSQGVMFMHCGQEFARSKQGEDNSYNLGDEINNIDWAQKGRAFRHFLYHRGAVRMRREHPMFRLRTRDEAERAVRFFDEELAIMVPPGVVAFELTDVTGHDAWNRAAVLLNGSGERAELGLPAGRWWCATRDGEFPRDGQGVEWKRGTIALRPHSGAVLYEKRG
ncbi:MAG: hypothetical protein AAGI30_04455 [Planctomycetota bacterium]